MNARVLPVRSMRSVARSGLIAAVIATIGNVLIYLVSSLLGVSFTVPTLPDPLTVTVFHVIGESLLTAVVACVIFALICRLSKRAVWLFRVLSVIVLVASFIPPLLLSTEPDMKIALSLMHIFSAIVIVIVLTRSPQPLT